MQPTTFSESTRSHMLYAALTITRHKVCCLPAQNNDSVVDGNSRTQPTDQPTQEENITAEGNLFFSSFSFDSDSTACVLVFRPLQRTQQPTVDHTRPTA